MNYTTFKQNLLEVITAFLEDMDEVHESEGLSASEKADKFQAVANRHGFPLEEVIQAG